MKKSTLLEIIAAITVLSMLLAACAPASAPAPQPTAVEAAETTPESTKEPVAETTKDTSPCHYIEEAYGDGFRYRESDNCNAGVFLIYSNAQSGVLYIALVEASKEWSEGYSNVTTVALYEYGTDDEKALSGQICNAINGVGIPKRIPYDGIGDSKSFINTYLVTHPCVVATPNPGG